MRLTECTFYCCYLNNTDCERNKSQGERSSNGCDKSVESDKTVLHEYAVEERTEMLPFRKFQPSGGPQVPCQSKFVFIVSVEFDYFRNQ